MDRSRSCRAGTGVGACVYAILGCYILATLKTAGAQTGVCAVPQPLPPLCLPDGTCVTLPPPGQYACMPDGRPCCFASGYSNCPVCGAISFRPSRVYGCMGELWTPTCRLPDWSYAGYMAGEMPIPDLPSGANLRTVFKARGDGKSDDTAALLAAINAVGEQGVIYIPAGTYLITQKVDISKRVVLRGEGRDNTTLLFNSSLSQLGGNTWKGGNSQYTYGPALLNFWGTTSLGPSMVLSSVTRNASRGDTRLWVASTALFNLNSWVRLTLDNTNNNSLAADLHSGLITPDTQHLNKQQMVYQHLRVVEIGPDYIGFSRPLLFNISTPWRPNLYSLDGFTRTLCGVEHLTIAFPWTGYQGMNKEQGYNALQFWNTPNSWVDDVNIINADLGLLLDGSFFFTVRGLTLSTTSPRNASQPGGDGTWGIWAKNGADLLITRFNITASFVQDISVQAFQAGTAITNGQGADLSVQALYAGPYATLVSNVQFGLARRPYAPSGAAPKSSSFFTLWNAQASVPLQMPRPMMGPRMNFIGAFLGPNANSTIDWFIENNRTITWPVDLQADQLARRLTADPLQGLSGPGYGCATATGTICCLAGGNASCPACPADYGIPSKLWGCGGELAAQPGSLGAARLLDWSYAGYKAGEAAIPQLPIVTNVMDFGATGDGVVDDTAAFQAAGDALGVGGVIYIPAGSYVITERVNFDNRVVLRGESRGSTRLVFPRSLREVYGNTSAWTFGPGFINWHGSNRIDNLTMLARVTADAPRGSSQLLVNRTDLISPGQWVRLVLDTPATGGLVTDLMSGMITEDPTYRNRTAFLSFISRVSVVGAGWVRLERALPYNVSTRYNPQLHDYNLGLPRQNVGVERLTLEFPLTPYQGYTTEAGYNGLYFWSTSNCWVRDVAIINADMGIAMDGTYFCTIQDVAFSSGPRGPDNGLWGIWLKNGADMLIRNVQVATRFMRDIAVQGAQVGTVVANCSGNDLSIDALYGGPYGLLHSNNDHGYGSRPLGGVYSSAEAASWNTIWNQRGSIRMPRLPGNYAPRMNFVYLNISDTSSRLDWYNENASQPVYPPDLYAAQRFARLGPWPAADAGPPGTPYNDPGYGCVGWRICCYGVGNSSCPVCPINATTPSSQYGCAGELWDPSTGRLPVDWSFAGYMGGDAPIPDVPVVGNVRDYGAKGDNVTDDTAAFQAALAAASVNNGALYIPPGVYRLTKVIETRKAVVLRGAGKDSTTLYFPLSLTDVYGNTWSEGSTGSDVSDYSHGTGFINFWGWDPIARDRTYLASVTAPASRGDTLLQVNTTTGMSVGQWVRLNMNNPANCSLAWDLNGGYMGCGSGVAGANSIVRHLSRITALGRNWVRLERPIIANVSLAWTPELHRFAPMTTQAGVEYLTVAFPVTPYPGHLKEMGYNGIHFNQLAHSWIRDVRVVNSDSAFYSWGMVFCSILGLEVASGPRGFDNGHRGIWLERGSDNLLREFNFTTRMYHDLSVSYYEHSTAFVNGTGRDVNMDHHRAMPHNILWSNLDLGIGSRTFDSSGDGGLNGNHSSSFITFWNTRGKLNSMLPGDDFGPNINFIGLKTQDWVKNNLGWLLDTPPNLVPLDLVNAMKATRASRLTQPPGVNPPLGTCAAAPPPPPLPPGTCNAISGTCAATPTGTAAAVSSPPPPPAATATKTTTTSTTSPTVATIDVISSNTGSSSSLPPATTNTTNRGSPPPPSPPASSNTATTG